MLTKNHVLDQIIEIIVREKDFIEKKCKLGLFDDNKHWENIIRNLLNDCRGYELENLNMDKANYPGIDLGDRSNGIGIQVTTTKTSAKIKNTLEKVMKEKVYEEFSSLKVFILGDKQETYTVDMQPYEGKIQFNLDEDIWDFQDLLKFLNNMNTAELTNILQFLQEECGAGGKCQKEDSQVAAMAIINYLNDIKMWIEDVAITGRAYAEFYVLENAQVLCEEIVPLLSTQEAIMINQLFESIERLVIEVGNVTNRDLSSYRLKYCANDILRRWEIYDILFLKCNMSKGALFNLVIDMDTFEARINALGIDRDLIEQQFSMDSFSNLLEKYKKQSCDNIIVIYKGESELLKNIARSKKVILEQYENKAVSLKKTFHTFKKRTKDFVVLTNDLEILDILGECRAEELKIVGVNLDDDLDWKLKGKFFDIIELGTEKDDFFLYDEEIYYNIRKLTKDDYRRMIANASNKHDHQLRVSKGGEVWMSRIVAAQDINDLQFRWETYDAYNGYVGPKAASDKEYVDETYNELKWEWDNGMEGYIDLWSAPVGIYT